MPGVRGNPDNFEKILADPVGHAGGAGKSRHHGTTQTAPGRGRAV